ncbi:MAG: hypothetical protein J0I06_21805 [Planctomycetes bacterium]|nr:hypothetical protein [Planctomycetota bacterium]
MDLGAPGRFSWPVDRAVLCVYLNPDGDLNRAVWQLESGTGTRFDCVFAVGVDGRVLYPPGGQSLTAALRALAGFAPTAFAAAENAVAVPAAGRFVCWERPRAPA